MKKGKITKKQISILLLYVALGIGIWTTDVYAANDPISAVNNLSNFIFGVIRAIGMIITGIAVVQFGMSFKSHDPSQRANSLLGIAGGLIITFAKEILNIIAG